MVVRAILFDLDGVLVDSFEAHFCAFNAALEIFSNNHVSLETFREKIWGRYIDKNVKNVFGNISKQKLKEIVEEYTMQMEKFSERIKIYPETKMVLTELKRNFKIGLVTSTQKESVDRIIEQFCLDSYFDVIICGDQVKKPKPAPEGILKACKSLKIESNEAMYVGDTYYDIVAGKSAGCFTVGMITTSGIEKLKDADKIIDNLTQMLALTI